MHRPQEALTARAVHAMVRDPQRDRRGPVTGVPVELVVTTGDAVDNAQWNEMRMFLALLEGGMVRPGSGRPRLRRGAVAVVARTASTGSPDGERSTGPDWYRLRYGFPHLPGLLDQAVAEFRSDGLRLPWLACFGNHEVHAQGMALLTPAIRAAFVGASKAVGYPLDLDRDGLLERVVTSPELLLAGPSSWSPPTRTAGRSAGRSSSTVTSARHRDPTATASAPPTGGTVRPTTPTTSEGAAASASTPPAGPVRSDGCLDDDQLHWLEGQLEAPIVVLAPDGTTSRPRSPTGWWCVLPPRHRHDDQQRGAA